MLFCLSLPLHHNLICDFVLFFFSLQTGLIRGVVQSRSVCLLRQNIFKAVDTVNQCFSGFFCYCLYLPADEMKTSACVCVHVCVSLMYRLEKWIYGEEIQYFGLTKM